MFGLVADIRRYPEFLPWCAASRVTSEETRAGKPVLIAEMLASYRGFEERFVSEVTLDAPAHHIAVAYRDGPFAHLANTWRFEPLGPDICRVHFEIDFAFKSRVLATVAGLVFGRVVTRMADAFEARARALYG